MTTLTQIETLIKDAEKGADIGTLKNLSRDGALANF